MLEKIINILEKFVEKYFIPSLVAVLPTAVIYYFTDDNFSILLKLGKQFYISVIFIIFFLLIELVIFLSKLIINTVKFKTQKTILEKEEMNESIKKIRESIDRLNPNERKLLDLFLSNNNEPIITMNYMDIPFLYNYCNYTKIITESNTKGINLHSLKKETYDKGYMANKYKLKDELYDILKDMLNNGIKISNF